LFSKSITDTEEIIRDGGTNKLW